jgi:hypothetical protein
MSRRAIGDHRAVGQFEIERRADEILRDLEELLRKRRQFVPKGESSCRKSCRRIPQILRPRRYSEARPLSWRSDVANAVHVT